MLAVFAIARYTFSDLVMAFGAGLCVMALVWLLYAYWEGQQWDN